MTEGVIGDAGPHVAQHAPGAERLTFSITTTNGHYHFEAAPDVRRREGAPTTTPLSFSVPVMRHCERNVRHCRTRICLTYKDAAVRKSLSASNASLVMLRACHGAATSVSAEDVPRSAQLHRKRVCINNTLDRRPFFLGRKVTENTGRGQFIKRTHVLLQGINYQLLALIQLDYSRPSADINQPHEVAKSIK